MSFLDTLKQRTRQQQAETPRQPFQPSQFIQNLQTTLRERHQRYQDEAQQAAQTRTRSQERPLVTEEERERVRGFEKGVVSILRDLPRSAGSLTLKATGQKEFTPNTGVERFVFGKEPVKTPEATGAEMLRHFGVSEEGSQQYGGVVGYPLAVLGALPFFPGKKKLAEAIARETSESAVKGVLKKGVKGISDSEAGTLARKLAPVKDTKRVQQELERFARTKQAGTRTTRRGVEEGVARLRGQGRTIDETAKTLGVSRERVRQVEAKLSAFPSGTRRPLLPGQRELQTGQPASRAGFQRDGTQAQRPFLQSLREKSRQLRAGPAGEPLDPGRRGRLPRGRQEGELGQGYSREAPLPSAYQKGGRAARDPQLNAYLRSKNWASRFMSGFKEKIVNDWERVRQISSDPNIARQGELTPYERRKLYFGRVSKRIERIEEKAREVLVDLMNASREAGVSDDVLRKDLNEYLVAKHAPERNSALGKPRAAGMSTKEAKEAVQRVESLPYAGKVKEIAQRVKAVNDQVLDILYQEGRAEAVIDKKLYDLLKNKYKEHVPLHRIFHESENVSQILSGKGLDVRGSGIYRAKGSERQVADVLDNVFSNYTQAVQRVEKNIVDNETLRFAREFNKAYPKLGLFEEIKPRAIGKSFSGEGMIFERIDDPTVLALREYGKQVYLKINDPRLAVALKGVNREKLPSYMRFIGATTRLLAGLATRFSAGFFLPNKVRDLQEAIVYMASQKGIGGKGALGMLRRDPGSAKDVMDWIRGVDSPGTRLYEQMRLDGGTTGGLALSTKAQVVKSLKDVEDQLKAGFPRRAGRNLIEAIDKWNQIFEDSTRLSAYKSALARGVSRERAALLAKEASVDFNQFGTYGPVINSLYMFSNASIQGSAKMIRAMKNPKVAAAVTSSVGASVWAANEWNDNVDPDWRNKVSKWDRINGLTIVLPSTDEEKFRHISVPVSWSIKPIKAAMEYGYDLASGHTDDIGGAFEGVLTSVIEGYNPLGEQDLFSALTPSTLDPLGGIKRNRAWWGGRIHPQGFGYAPQSELYYRSLEESVLGKAAIWTTKGLYEATGGRIDISPADVKYFIEQYTSGAGRFTSKTVTTIAAVGQGDLPSARQTPFLSRFLRSRDIEETGAGTSKVEDIQETLEVQSRERLQAQREAEKTWDELTGIESDEEYGRAWNTLVAENRDLAQRVKELAEEESLGLTYEDRLVKQLGVGNWERARYLHSYLAELPEGEYESAWRELARKGVITKTVSEQIQALMREE